MKNFDKKFIREIGILNEKDLNILKNSHIIICGLGGVGSYTFEMLVRSGIGNFTIIDFDKIEESNINRQLESFTTNINEYKTNVYENRAKKINPNININSITKKISEDNINEIFNIEHNNSFSTKAQTDNNENYNKENNSLMLNRIPSVLYIVDCIDDVKAKIAIAKYAFKNNIKLISSMGTANHINTNNIKIRPLSKTRYCPLSKIIRSELYNKMKIDMMTLFIDEEQIKLKENINKISTISYVVATCGIKIAEYVINDILNQNLS